MPDWNDTSTRSWDAVADDWVDHADHNDYRNVVLLPLAFELLGGIAGLRILDLGCGEGGYGREMAARGAQVTGVDGSPQLIAVARQRAAQAGHSIEYLCANASSLDALRPASFDRVLASMSLMDVENYDAAVGEIRRVLVPGGKLLMSITHPCFSAPTSRWVEEASERTHFAVDRYFERAVWDDFIAAKFRKPVLRRHRPLEDYLRPLLAAGFILRDFREPSATPEQIEKSARLRCLTRVPYFLFMSWEKAAAAG